jgi:hypothetical protein
MKRLGCHLSEVYAAIIRYCQLACLLEQLSDQLGIFATVALFPLTHEIYDQILRNSPTHFRLQGLFLFTGESVLVCFCPNKALPEEHLSFGFAQRSESCNLLTYVALGRA